MRTEQTEGFARDGSDVAQAARREFEDAKARLSDAAGRVTHGVKQGAQGAGSTLSALVLDELDRRAADMGAQIRLVAARLRGESAETDTAETGTAETGTAETGTAKTGRDAAATMAAHAADLIEDVSSRLEGQSVREMGDRLSQFGRANPALFVMGCLLTGAMAGRMIVASGSSGDGQSRSRRQSGGSTGASGRSHSDRSHFDRGQSDRGQSDLGQSDLRQREASPSRGEVSGQGGGSGGPRAGAASGSPSGTPSGAARKPGADGVGPGVVGPGSAPPTDGSDASRQSRSEAGKVGTGTVGTGTVGTGTVGTGKLGAGKDE